MENEYNFSKAARVQLFKPDATLSLPIYLDSEIQSYLRE